MREGRSKIFQFTVFKDLSFIHEHWSCDSLKSKLILRFKTTIAIPFGDSLSEVGSSNPKGATFNSCSLLAQVKIKVNLFCAYCLYADFCAQI